MVTECVFFLSVRTLLVMSATDRPTDHDRWPLFFIIPKALDTLRKRLRPSSAHSFLTLKNLTHRSSRGLVDVDPGEISGLELEFGLMLLITATVNHRACSVGVTDRCCSSVPLISSKPS